MKKSIAFSVIFLFIISIGQSQDFEDVQISTKHVRDNIYVLFGAGGNIGVLKGDDGFVILDDQFEGLNGKITAALAEIDSKEISYVINTHFHFDHADGNKAFGKSGTTIIAHENTRKRLMEDILVEVPGFDTILQEKYPPKGLPSITFESSLKLHMNDQTIHLFHINHAHTDTDAIIFFEESNVFHMGDIFVRYGIPFIDAPNGGSFSGLLAGVNRLIDLCDDQTLIIPGHGQLSNKPDLISFRDMLQEIWDRVEDQVSLGKSLSDILDTHPAKGFMGELHADYIVMMIYEELK
jgi:glyoxylase-like metal-dependent hydrolase (beta-lactamase superfamily II)